MRTKYYADNSLVPGSPGHLSPSSSKGSSGDVAKFGFNLNAMEEKAKELMTLLEDYYKLRNLT